MASVWLKARTKNRTSGGWFMALIWLKMNQTSTKSWISDGWFFMASVWLKANQIGTKKNWTFYTFNDDPLSTLLILWNFVIMFLGCSGLFVLNKFEWLLGLYYYIKWNPTTSSKFWEDIDMLWCKDPSNFVLAIFKQASV